ncbi:complement C3-like [Halichoeres trimaculatus]|uniref:complement C3-like n=1 Tax=Halichoeres trimaculatus TaxID=147232 RepID=UPI003D9F32CE
MGSGRTACRIQLWLLALLAFSCQVSLSEGTPRQVLSAPNLLRVGTAENIFVECQYCTGGDINVEIKVMNYQNKTEVLASTTVTLTRRNNFQQFGKVTIPPGGFSRDPNMKQYVYLQAQFPNRRLEKIVLLSFQSGYIFIQTDKTLYTPNSAVRYRIFALTPGMFHGLWKLVAKFHHNPHQSFSAAFEVKEYVLPNFEVKLIPSSHFFHVDDQELTIHIKARYLFDEAVEGTAYAVFGVIHEGRKKSFSSSLQKVMIKNGEGEATLRREHITQTFLNILDLVGQLIYVTVTVQAENGGEMVETELNGLKIEVSPYTINFKKTPKYYQPRQVFYVTVEVMNHDGTPARGVEVELDSGDMRGRTDANGIVGLFRTTLSITGPLTITARTNDHHIPRRRQATQTMVALPYKTKSDSLMYMDVIARKAQVGESLKISLLAFQETSRNDITYLILSRGQLISFGRLSGYMLRSMAVSVTKEMVPSFRIIAYCHTDNGDVVSDSVWVDVEDSCMGSLELEETSSYSLQRPGSTVGLRVTGDPGATVALVARDKSLYTFNNKNHLTQKKLWDIVEKYDTGCTPGGGADSMGVFYDAGLLFESSTTGTPHRLDPKCAGHSRWKRASTSISSDELEDYSYVDSEDIFRRTAFHESWLWSSVTLPNCPINGRDCGTTSFQRRFPLPDSITTWQVTGISLSQTHGICVSDPLELTATKQFFIDLKLPYSAVQGKQLEIKAVLHNYSPDPFDVRVDLIESQHFCSAASMRGKYRQVVRVEASATRSVPFILYPTTHGEFEIEVKAAVKDGYLSDGVRKKLLVLPHGILVKSLASITLDPARKGGIQYETVNSKIPRKYIVPKTPTRTEISVTMRQRKEAQLEHYISGNSMGSLIKPPQRDSSSVLTMTLPIIAATYLDKTNQWEAVGLEKRSKALEYIKSGYTHTITFQADDGAFRTRLRLPYRFISVINNNINKNRWLTASVVKLFTMASNLVHIERKVICDAVSYLIEQAPTDDFTVCVKKMCECSSDMEYKDSDVSVTAFCLIAMQESLSLCLHFTDDDAIGLFYGTSQSIAYLEMSLPSLTNPHTVAMASYALANDNRLNKKILYKFASKDLTHWPTPEGHTRTLETTAYALLALVKANAFEEARPVVKWLNQQQRQNGQYGSEDATLLVYQAVAEYWTTVKEKEYDLSVDIWSPSRSRTQKLFFNSRHPAITRTSQMNGINMDIGVTAEGTGEAALTVVSHYYTQPGEKETDCENLKLSVELLPEITGASDKIYRLRIEALYMNKDDAFTNAVLEVGLLRGFTVNASDLSSLSRSQSFSVEDYEKTILSDSIIIHLPQLSHRQPKVIEFRIHESTKLQVLQPAAVFIYEHNKREPSCVKFYHPERKNGALPRHCTNGECTCPAGKQDLNALKKTFL